MSKVGDFFGSHHIQLALATGASIITLAFFSKRVLPEPIPTLHQALPPFVAVLAEGVISQRKDSRIARTWVWVLAILLSTVLVIGLHWA
jgi:hypothetical protein